ncbi:putative aarF domain-containing protein kinase chloroplastic-like, partial [Trifolium medium]|nr:putative aarF domain-containing protein kinase chloroplastic-like [Trifolium medium]
VHVCARAPFYIYLNVQWTTVQVIQCLIDLGALQPTGDLSAVRRSVQYFLDNLLSQTPDQQQTLSAIGEE